MTYSNLFSFPTRAPRVSDYVVFHQHHAAAAQSNDAPRHLLSREKSGVVVREREPSVVVFSFFTYYDFFPWMTPMFPQQISSMRPRLCDELGHTDIMRRGVVWIESFHVTQPHESRSRVFQDTEFFFFS
jgi:hypothetical protein